MDEQLVFDEMYKFVMDYQGCKIYKGSHGYCIFKDDKILHRDNKALIFGSLDWATDAIEYLIEKEMI